MDLANMRSHGVGAVEASCYCGRRAVVHVSALPGEVEVPALRLRLRCSGCGARPYDVRPNWRERVTSGKGMGC